MAVITFPDFAVASFRWHKSNQAVTFRSIFGSQSVEAASPLWSVEMMGVSESRADARQIQAYFESLNGFQNQVELWNIEHPVPAGTMRGTMTFAAATVQGAGTIQIAGGLSEAGKTLLKGDLIGFGSGTTQQVVRITADATADASGNITVSIGTPLRNAFSAGASITWDKPKALFRQKSLTEGIEFTPEGGQPWSLSLIEDWRV
jgi:hypothetical protein